MTFPNFDHRLDESVEPFSEAPDDESRFPCACGDSACIGDNDDPANIRIGKGKKYSSAEHYIHENTMKLPDAPGCWLWMLKLNKSGYGSGSQRFGFQLVHRLSYSTFISTFDKSLGVLHRCDNRACVNPSHLFLGTNDDNVRDRWAKGRFLGVPHKLDPSAVLEIRKSEGLQREIGERFGVTYQTVQAIKARKTWRHLPEAV